MNNFNKPDFTKPVNIKNLKNTKNNYLGKKLKTAQRGLILSTSSGFKHRSFNDSIIEIDERRFKDSILVNDPIETTASLTSNEAGKYRSQSFLLSNLNYVNDDDVDENEDCEEACHDADDYIPKGINKSSEEEKRLIDDEIRASFTPELAYQAYFNISRRTSGTYVDSILKNTGYIMKMCNDYEKILNENKQTATPLHKHVVKIDLTPANFNTKRTSTQVPIRSINSSSYGSSFNENISIVGSQIHLGHTKFRDDDLKSGRADTTHYLADNWLAYWEHEIRQNNEKFDFKHINLASLVGHTGAVKCLTYMYDNENVLLSSSRDKTVKLWSIKNLKTLSPQWTYGGHKKTVFSVLFLNNLRQCVSCDGQIHTWDPFYGKKLSQYDWPNPINCQTAVDNLICFGTQDNLVKFIDIRTKTYAHEFRTYTGKIYLVPIDRLNE